jgi:ribosomal protein S27E
VVTYKKWMDMTPKKEVRIFRLKCYLCRQEAEVFSDELYKIRKCSSCKAAIDPNRCQVIQVH